MSQIAFEHSETQGLISIVMPTYRGERYIGDALASIGSQTDHNWEVVVVEDGSRGATERIVREFAEKHPWHRVHYIRNEQNRGPSHARNTAFKHVRGQYVALLDSDDRWYPDYLACMRTALETTGKDIAYCSVVMIEDTTDLLIGAWGPTGEDIANFPLGLLSRNFINPSATMLRRSVLADVGNWNTQHRLCEDLEFWLRCATVLKTFQYVGGVHCLYRRNHAEAATGKMCAVQEAHCKVVEQFLDLPGTRKQTCRKFVSRSYVRAAEFHEGCNPEYDSSADRNRAPRLLLRAWYFRRNHVDYVWRAFKLTIRNSPRRIFALFKRSPKPVMSTVADTISVPTQAAA
jgi:glycosyltransferase involved in cell wall biosynthesis